MSQEYLPLPGRGIRRDGNFFIAVSVRRSRLWLGKDHILLVDSTSADQDLKRFYFRHIQAFVVRRTARWSVLSLAFGIITAVFLLLLATFTADAARYPCGVIAGLFGLLLLINLLKGPTADCFIQTAVQREKLPSLGRLRNARKVLARLRPLIDEAQGKLTPEQLAAEWQSLAASGATPPRAAAGWEPPSGSSPAASSAYQGGAHAWLFRLLLFEGVLNLVLIYAHNFGLVLAHFLLVMVLVTLELTALVKQHDSRLSGAVKNKTWAALGYFAFGMIVAMVFNFVIAMRDPGAMQDTVSQVMEFAKMQPLDTPALLLVYVIAGIASFMIGMLGLAALRQSRAEQAALLAAAASIATASVPPQPPRLPPQLPPFPPPPLPTPAAPPPLPAPPVAAVPPPLAPTAVSQSPAPPPIPPETPSPPVHG